MWVCGGGDECVCVTENRSQLPICHHSKNQLLLPRRYQHKLSATDVLSFIHPICLIPPVKTLLLKRLQTHFSGINFHPKSFLWIFTDYWFTFPETSTLFTFPKIGQWAFLLAGDVQNSMYPRQIFKFWYKKALSTLRPFWEIIIVLFGGEIWFSGMRSLLSAKVIFSEMGIRLLKKLSSELERFV